MTQSATSMESTPSKIVISHVTRGTRVGLLRMTPFGIAKNLKLTTLDALAHRDVIPEPLQLLAVGAALGLFGGEGFLGRHALAA